jgi:transcription termination/antitermination protein NusG
MNWYAVHTYSGFEKKVKRDIEHRASIEGLREALGQVIVPEEKIVEIKDTKRKESSRNFMPGYVFLEMEPINDLFKMVREVNGVSNFAGTGDTPVALTQEEISNILGLIEDKKDKPKAEIKFRKGDKVKVIEGAFANFQGTVEDIDHEKARLRVMVSIFGRATPVDLNVLEVDSI